MTWQTERAALPPDWTEAQYEAVRRAGARRRHAERVAAADSELTAISVRCRLFPEARSLIAQAIERALQCIGMPGSASGTSPPGWYRAHPYVHARIAAMRQALLDWVTSDALHGGEIQAVAGEDYVWLTRADNGETVGRVPVAEFPVLAEHLLAALVEPAATAVERWLTSDRSVPFPPPPDATLVGMLETLRERRRAGR